ncbi:prominin-1-A-like [Babylonia areolata]|uniref:prominin-1-A-like n=1 Tax=Babylonia areolata TaxID=304850 RepID=UPI003FCEE84B
MAEASAQTVYASDAHGNVVYDNGTVVFVRPFPVGNVVYKTSTDYDDLGLGILFAFARSFINTVQSEPFPFDILKGMMNGEFNFSENYMEVVNYAMGLAVCLAIGLLFVLLFAMCGCCLCCCRNCCGNCGGDGEQTFDPNEGCKRMGYGQFLFMMAACMFVAGCCVYVTNDQFASAVSFANSTTANNLDDIETYISNTIDEFNYLLVDLYSLIHEAIVQDIDKLGTLVEEALEDILNVDAVFDSVHELDTSVDAVSTSLSQVRSDLNTLKAAVSSLSTALDTLANDVDSTTAGCPSDCSPNQCSLIDSDDIRGSAMNTSNLPNLDSVQIAVDDVKAANLSGLADSAESSLDQISVTVDSDTASVRTAVNTTMSDYAVLIQGATGSVLTDMQNALPVADTKKLLGGYFATAQEYDIYRQYVGMGLAGAFMALVGLLVLGMMLGVLCDDKKKLPTERGFCSNCGGCLIMVAVMLMFLLGPPLMLLTTISFLLGGLFEKTCQPLFDLSIFSEFVDTGAIPGFSLGLLLLGNSSVNLRMYDILLGCRADKAPFDLMKLNTKIPLDDYLNYTKYLSGLDENLNNISNVDISSYKVLTPAMEQALTNLQNSGINSINFTDIDNQLNQSASSFNTGSAISTMTTIKSQCVDPTKAALKASLAILEADLAPVDGNINTSLTVGRAANDRIQNNMTDLLTEVYNEIGRCTPLWNLYRSFTVMLCNYGVDALNGFWFSLGWGLFFFIPVVIVGVTLSGFYSTMTKIKGWPDPNCPPGTAEKRLVGQSKTAHMQDDDLNCQCSPAPVALP